MSISKEKRKAVYAKCGGRCAYKDMLYSEQERRHG